MGRVLSHSNNTNPYQLLWQQSFDDPSATVPDARVWNYDLGDGTAVGIPGWGNQEREYYVADAIGTASDGAMHIAARRLPADNPYPAYYGGNAEWSSGKLTTHGKVHFLYGRVEAELRLPVGIGSWPAFWMLGANLPEVGWPQCGEIDIMEHRGDQPNRLYTTVHGPGYCGDQGRGEVFDFDYPLAGQTRKFSVDWLPDSISWQVDGVTKYTLNRADLQPHDWVFDHPHYLIVNLAMGGNFCGPISPDLEAADYYIEQISHYSIDGIGEVIHPVGS